MLAIRDVDDGKERKAAFVERPLENEGA